MIHSVLLHIHPVIGADFENSLTPPTPPNPVPFIPYSSVTFLSGNLIQSKMSKKSYALFKGVRIMNVGTDCGMLGVPHFGNPANILYPMILTLSSSSKSPFGSATVKVEGNPVACALAGLTGINTQCGTVTSPTGAVPAPTTVFAGLTWGDI